MTERKEKEVSVNQRNISQEIKKTEKSQEEIDFNQNSKIKPSIEKKTKLLNKWKIVSSSFIGRGHVQSGTPCQDKTFQLVDIKEDFYGLSLADGAGSCKHSEEGAELITKEILHYIKQNFNIIFNIDRTDNKMKEIFLIDIKEKFDSIFDIEKINNEIRKNFLSSIEKEFNLSIESTPYSKIKDIFLNDIRKNFQTIFQIQPYYNEIKNKFIQNIEQEIKNNSKIEPLFYDKTKDNFLKDTINYLDKIFKVEKSFYDKMRDKFIQNMTEEFKKNINHHHSLYQEKEKKNSDELFKKTKKVLNHQKLNSKQNREDYYSNVRKDIEGCFKIFSPNTDYFHFPEKMNQDLQKERQSITEQADKRWYEFMERINHDYPKEINHKINKNNQAYDNFQNKSTYYMNYRNNSVLNFDRINKEYEFKEKLYEMININEMDKKFGKFFQDYLTQRSNKVFDIDSNKFREKFLLKHIEEKLESHAIDKEYKLKDLSSTLLFVAVKKKQCIFGHIGDGVIGILDNQDNLQVISLPENGEYANSTFFTTSTDYKDRLRIKTGTLTQTTGFILMSDGAGESLYNKRKQSLSSGNKTMINWLKEYEEKEVKEALHKNLEQVLSKRTTDDCSIGIMRMRE